MKRLIVVAAVMIGIFGCGETDSTQSEQLGQDEDSQALCPAPIGIQGILEGNILPNVNLTDCAGNPFQFYDLCGRQAGHIFVFAGNCLGCRAYAQTAESLYQSFEGQNFESYFVIHLDDSGGTPTAPYCEVIRSQYGLSMPVLFANFGTLERASMNQTHLHYVVDSEMRIQYRGQWTPADAAYPEAARDLLQD